MKKIRCLSLISALSLTTILPLMISCSNPLIPADSPWKKTFWFEEKHLISPLPDYIHDDGFIKKMVMKQLIRKY